MPLLDSGSDFHLFNGLPCLLVLRIDHSSVDKRSITFNWTDALSPVGAKYVIRYNRFDEQGRPIPMILETPLRTITVKGLTPYTQYSFTVERKSAVKGLAAPLVKRTLPDVPSAPLDVTARSNDTWVLLNWQVPLYPNGEIRNYKILYTTDNSQSDDERIPKDVGGKMAYHSHKHIHRQIIIHCIYECRLGFP